MARRKKHKCRDKKEYYDPPIWVEGRIFDERTGTMVSVKYKLRKRC